jgi:hypothetical protein
MSEGANPIGPPYPTDDWKAGFSPPRKHLALAWACVALFYLAGVTGQWWPTKDSATYLGLARSLADGQGYVFNGQPNNFFTPGLPYLLAGMRLLGFKGFWAPNFFIVLCGLGTIGLTYASLRRLTGEGLLSMAIALATAMSYTFYLNSHRILTDVPGALVFWSLIYCVLRSRGGRWGWLALAGLLSGAGIVLRAPLIVLIGPMVLGLLLDRRILPPGRRFLTCAVIAAAALAALGFFLVRAYQVQPETPNYLHLMSTRSGLPAYLRRLAHGLPAMPTVTAEMFTSQEALWPIGLAVLILEMIGIVRFWQAGRRMAPTLAILCPVLLALSMSNEGMRSRYLLPIQALMLLLAADGLGWCVRTFSRLRRLAPRPQWSVWAILVFLGLAIVCNLPRTSRNAFYYSYLSYGPDYYRKIREAKYADIYAAASILQRDCSPEALAAAPADETPVLHFLSNRRILALSKNQGSDTPSTGAILGMLAADANLKFVILESPRVDRSSSDPPAALAAIPGMRLVLTGRYYLVYRRV